MITYNQLSLAEIFSDCQDYFNSDKRALIIQRIFSIPTDSLLITFLSFQMNLENWTYNGYLITLLILLTDLPKFDSDKTSMTIFDTSGIKHLLIILSYFISKYLTKHNKGFKITLLS
ncbi:hypothetical protein [Vallitalea sp.]|jgi:hypothetical protein|uniref:hypothetical protein n=1 Tax=Vallitalea sp. TaxID=1882829 RepID=UPI003FCD80E3